MPWLLTGGAGYIGAHVGHALRESGVKVVVVDDLSTGLASRVPDSVPLVEADVLDTDLVGRVVRGYGVRGVMHFAAKKSVGESVSDPLQYYRSNVAGFASVLQAAVENGVDHVVLSSSAAVWGDPGVDRVTEDVPARPTNPYGETKLVCEWMLRDVGHSNGLRWAALRYFNVAGSGSPGLSDTSVSNLIPMIFKALDSGLRPQVFGGDYPTRDGTAVRDYVHVSDLAEAHVAAARRLTASPGGAVYAIGRGEGVTVLEVLAAVRRVTNLDVDHETVGRRAGDPAGCFADPTRAEHDLGWRAQRGLDEIVASAWGGWCERRDTTAASTVAEARRTGGRIGDLGDTRRTDSQGRWPGQPAC